jgi:hypothetical protein
LVYTCSPARHLSRRYEVVPACKANRNTMPQGLLAAAHKRPHGHPASGAGTACCIALFGPLSVRCFRLCPRRRRRQAFPVDRRCLHRGAANCPCPKGVRLITAVPVTDDEHVATDDVIARIDDRDYRIRRRRHKSRPRKPASRISTRAECAASTDQRPTLRANARSIARAPQANEFAASLNRRPVIKFVAHGLALAH